MITTLAVDSGAAAGAAVADASGAAVAATGATARRPARSATARARTGCDKCGLHLGPHDQRATWGVDRWPQPPGEPVWNECRVGTGWGWPHGRADAGGTVE